MVNSKKIILDYANYRLKKLETFEELQKFLEYINSLWDRGVFATLVMKQSGYQALDFTESKSPTRVKYILDDGISFRESEVKNLHRNIKIVE